jgi:predicted RNA-binding protein with PUA-like domain
MQYWLIKSEPFKYPWSQLVEEGVTYWSGVRNYQARNYMMQMEVGDLCLFYHSNEGKAVVGIAQVVKAHYPDPTVTADEKGQWVVVDVAPYQALPQPVTLQQMRDEPLLADLNIFKQMRLSVVSVSSAHFDLIVGMGHPND